jgi:hypothetical protein
MWKVFIHERLEDKNMKTIVCIGFTIDTILEIFQEPLRDYFSVSVRTARL